VVLNKYDKIVVLLASVGWKWVFISLASHRLSNNLDNGDDDLRFPRVKESCWIDWGPKMGAPFQPLALQIPSKEAGSSFIIDQAERAPGSDLTLQ
jgi:hypothetical protein